MTFSIDAVSSAATTLFDINSSPILERQFQSTLAMPADSKPQDKGNPGHSAKRRVTEDAVSFNEGVDASYLPWGDGFLSR